MYAWRSMSEAERQAVLEQRKALHYPWHGPPSLPVEGAFYHLTAACYEHALILGRRPERLTEFEAEVLGEMTAVKAQVRAWCFLPNYYHLLVGQGDVLEVRRVLGLLHGRSARTWNLADARPGRKVWHRTADRFMRGEGHYWATVNYIHNNPVKHGWARRWQDWPWSSALEFLERAGREQVERIWNTYRVLDYGRGWDD